MSFFDFKKIFCALFTIKMVVFIKYRQSEYSLCRKRTVYAKKFRDKNFMIIYWKKELFVKSIKFK